MNEQYIRLIRKNGRHLWDGKEFLAKIIYCVSNKVAHYLVHSQKLAELIDKNGCVLYNPFSKETPVPASDQLNNKDVSSVSVLVDNNKIQIAAIRIGGIGDAVELSGFAVAVKRKFPDAQLTLYIRDNSCREILLDHPSIDRIVMAGNKDWPSFLKHVLSQDRYDIVYDCRYMTKTYFRNRDKYIKYADECDKVFAPYEQYYHNFPHQAHKLAKNVSVSNRTLMRETACLDGSDDDLSIVLNDENKNMLHLIKNEKYVTIHNGSDMARQTKCWLTKHWNEVVKYLRKKKYKVIQFGIVCDDVVDDVINMVGHAELKQAAALIEGARFHIDTEGGLVHIAHAVGTRSICLFGPTPESFFGYEENINVVTPVDCKSCWWSTNIWWRECPKKYPYPVKCMKEITPNMVFKAINKIEKMKAFKKVYKDNVVKKLNLTVNELSDYDPNDVNEKFALELPLTEEHYKSEPWQWDRIYTMMEKVKGKTVLEVGAGDGYCLKILSKRGFDVIGTEVSKIRLKRMLDQGLNAVYGDINRLPFPDKYFDSVIAGEVLEHIPSMADGLKELERVCKDDGIIILSIPIAPIFKDIEMHLWGIDHHVMYRNGKMDMIVLGLERIHRNVDAGKR